MGELLDDLITEYTINGRRSVKRARFSVAHLRGFFGSARAQALDPALVRDYIARRQSAGVSNATVNRELAALKRSLTLAVQGRKILSRPYIPMLAENNVRSGFFEREQLEAVQRHLPAATTDARSKTDRIIPHIFHRDGAPIRSFRRAWQSACESAGVPGRIFHDFRRTAVRNLERAGVPRSVAMQMVGHRTEAIYRRYAIVSDADLRAAADKLAAIEPGTPTGTITGTVTRIGAR